MVYEPQEDSFLLREFVRRFARGNVLDVGTGSGIQAVEASHSRKTKSVFAVDVDSEAVKYCKKFNDKGKHTKVKWLLSDLFSAFNGKKFKHFFDVIIFNAPYLPQDHRVRDIALEGGRQGHEVIERFLLSVGEFLKRDGVVLLVFSSLTPHIPALLEKNLLVGRELGRRHMFFEDIFVFSVVRSPILNELERKGVCDLKFFAMGNRGVVFTGKFKGKKIAVKVKRESSMASEIVSREANMLKELNKHGIGPKYLFHTSKFLVYEFVEGEHFKDLLKSKKVVAICKNVLEQCFLLDSLHIDKQEWTRPYKHVIVKGNKVSLIDFERARRVEEAHNVTQFCTFVLNHVDKKHRKKWISLARAYSVDKSRANFDKLLGLL